MSLRIWVVICALLSMATAASASPNVPLDDPVYQQLAILQGQGRLMPIGAGLFPLTEAQIQSLLVAAGEPPDPRLSHFARGDWTFWLVPLRRITARLSLSGEYDLPYSTATRPEQMAGQVAVSCEYQEGRPCGRGIGAVLDVDSSAGFGRYFSFYTRLRLVAGSDGYAPDGLWDRAYVHFEWRKLTVEVGRDSFSLGPGVHAQMLWGRQAAPLDQARIAALDLTIPRVPGRIFRFGVLYVIGRLRQPQLFNGTMVDILRGQLTLFENFEVAATNLLQFGGTGAVSESFGGWIADHFTRQIVGKLGADSSNRRVSFDLSYVLRPLHSARLYYEVAFEDWRKDFLDALQFDADHLGGIEVPALDRRGRYGLLVEYQHIGVRSQTHGYWTTGMTNAGFSVGTPLGPDAWSIYAALRIALPKATLTPALELVRRSSDHYHFVDYGPIYRVSSGVEETRARAFLQCQLKLLRDVRLDARAFLEEISHYDFLPAATRTGAGLDVSLVWSGRSN